MKLLITSVGSLLGQNILDSIKDKRDVIKVIGLDAGANNPRNFRCDKTYLVPFTDAPNFKTVFEEIIEKESPDFILAGRDGDSIFLSDIKQEQPNKYHNKIPFGTSEVPKMMINKVESFEFAKKYNLPFADSFFYRNINDDEALQKFISKHGFPLLVKPKEGFGSHGVCYIINNEQIETHKSKGEFFLQEFLGNPEHILQYKDFHKTGIPLFFQLPEEDHYAAQTIIAPDGTIDDVFFTINTMVLGRAEKIEVLYDDKVNLLVANYCKAFYENGWYGPTNFQLKQDKNGTWKVFELNSRLTGTSSARVLLGYDEFGKLTDLFIPQFKLPNFSKKPFVKGIVYKYLTDYLFLEEDAKSLKLKGSWKKS